MIERVAREPGGWQCSVLGVDDGYTSIFTYDNSLNSTVNISILFCIPHTFKQLIPITTVFSNKYSGFQIHHN